MTFAEKVVVMYEGEILQIGTPEELFDNPQHTFVGYFIGSPGMNFLPCTIEEGAARVAGGSIALDPATLELAAKAEGRLEVGIRPMYLQLHDAPVAKGLKAKVSLVEDQGNCKIATLRLNGSTLRARLPEEMPTPGEETWLVFPPQYTKMYADGRLLQQQPV